MCELVGSQNDQFRRWTMVWNTRQGHRRSLSGDPETRMGRREGGETWGIINADLAEDSLKLACGEATTLSCEGWTLEVILRRWVSNPRTVEMGERVGLILRPPPMHWSTLLKLSWYHQSEKCFATEQVIQVYKKWPKQSSITQWLNHVPPRR